MLKVLKPTFNMSSIPNSVVENDFSTRKKKKNFSLSELMLQEEFFHALQGQPPPGDILATP
jgi:transcriptional regulator of met regulon